MPEGARKFLPLEERGYSEKIPAEQLQRPTAAEQLAQKGAEKTLDDRLTGRHEPSVVIDSEYQKELQKAGLSVERAPANHEEKIVELTDEDIELIGEPKAEPSLVSLEQATAELNPQGGGMAHLENQRATPPPIPTETAAPEAPGELRVVGLDAKGDVVDAGSAEQLPAQMDAERQAREKAEAEEKAFFEAQAKRQAAEREVARKKLEEEKQIKEIQAMIRDWETHADKFIDSSDRHAERQQRFQAREAVATYQHLEQLQQAQTNPDQLSQYSATLEQQNRELLSRPTDTLISFVKDKWNIKLGRDGKPSMGSRFKGLFGRNKSAESDPLFQTLQAEIQKRYQQTKNALK